MKKLLIAALLFATPALAADITVPLTPGSGTNYVVGNDASGNAFGYYGLCDGAACLYKQQVFSNLAGSVQLISQYPAGATKLVTSSTGTTAAVSAAITATASQYSFLCSFYIRANATAATTVNATVSDGTFTLNFTEWVAPNASGIGLVEENLIPCVYGSAVNTAITVTSGAAGTGGVTSVTAIGYTKATAP